MDDVRAKTSTDVMTGVPYTSSFVNQRSRVGFDCQTQGSAVGV